MKMVSAAKESTRCDSNAPYAEKINGIIAKSFCYPEGDGGEYTTQRY
jgi:hypothetical protein